MRNKHFIDCQQGLVKAAEKNCVSKFYLSIIFKKAIDIEKKKFKCPTINKNWNGK